MAVPTLKHRYSFSEASGSTVSDSVGGPTYDATLQNGAYLSNGAVMFAWDGVDPNKPHVELPAGLFVGSTDITLEIWFSTGATEASWVRLMQFASALGDNTDSFLMANDAGAIQVYLNDGGAASVYQPPQAFTGLTDFYIAIVVNPSANSLKIYTNGGLLYNAGLSLSLPEPGLLIYNYLGLSNHAVDPGLVDSSITEFRVWDYVLDYNDVAQHNQGGPDAVVTPTAAPTEVPTADPTEAPTREPSSLPSGQPSSTPTCVPSSPPTSNPSSLPSGQPSSSPTCVPSSPPTSNPSSLPSGAPTLTPSSQPTTPPTPKPSAAPTRSPTRSPTLVPTPVLRHRYSFTTQEGSSVADVVGGSSYDAVLQNGAYVSDGAVQFEWDGVDPNKPHVELPPSLFASSTDVTLEMWCSTSGTEPLWARLMEFASAMENNYDSLLLCNDGTPGYENNMQLYINSGGTANYMRAPQSFVGLTNVYLAVVINPTAGHLKLYVNGNLVQTTTSYLPLPPAAGMVHNYLGLSNHAADGALTGASISEFRVWDTELTATDIAIHYSNGPDDAISPTASPTAIPTTGMPSHPPTSRPSLAATVDNALCSFTRTTKIGSVQGYSKWRCNTNGKLRSHPCANKWPGIVCDDYTESGVVISISLPNVRVRGHLPPELFFLTGLEYLDLAHNMLTGTLPTAVGDLTALKHLDISGNSITGELPSQLGQLADLRYLLAMGTQVNGTIPTSIGNLGSLRGLVLSMGKFTGSVPSEVGALDNVFFADLSANLLTGTLPTSLSSMSSLVLLDVSRNMLAGTIPTQMGNMASLQSIQVDGNTITGPNPAANFYPLTLEDNELGHLVYNATYVF